jgi:nucleoside-diphosphate kinase
LTERTLVLIKPDGVRRGLIGDVLARIERKGLQIVAMDLRILETATAQTHYAEHSSKPFFDSLVEFITSGPLIALVAEGPRAIEAFRGLAGATDPGRSCVGSAGEHRARIGLARLSRAGNQDLLSRPRLGGPGLVHEGHRAAFEPRGGPQPWPNIGHSAGPFRKVLVPYEQRAGFPGP